MAQLKLFNNDILIAEWVGPDIQNSDEYIIQVVKKISCNKFFFYLFLLKIDQTNLGLPSKEYYLDDANWKYLDSYRIFIINTVHILGANIETAVTEVNEIIEFETNLAKVITTKPF